MRRGRTWLVPTTPRMRALSAATAAHVTQRQACAGVTKASRGLHANAVRGTVLSAQHATILRAPAVRRGVGCRDVGLGSNMWLLHVRHSELHQRLQQPRHVCQHARPRSHAVPRRRAGGADVRQQLGRHKDLRLRVRPGLPGPRLQLAYVAHRHAVQRASLPVVLSHTRTLARSSAAPLQACARWAMTL